MKKNKPFGELFYRSLKKILLTMRIATFILILGILQVHAVDTYSQKTRLTINFSDAALVSVLDKIEVESEFFFLYNEKLLDTERKVNVSANNQLINVILDNLFAGTDIKYSIIDRKIILAPDYLTEVSQPQQKRIAGTITDKDGTPLPGVNIVVTGTIQGTITDIAGKYSIEVPQGAKSLTFSFVGMVPQEINIGTLTQINVTMAESAIGLDEVVVIGYGTQKKSDLTGSAFQVTSNIINNQSMTKDPIQILQGKVPGLDISTGNKPGDVSTMVIRGYSSITASNTPLIVLDGAPFAGRLSDINPSEIEKIDILKDASSTAIYGSQGANGIIIITTKRAKMDGKINISYDGYFGISKSFKNYNLMDGEKWASFKAAAYPQLTWDMLWDEYETKILKEKSFVDWQKLMFSGTGYETDNNLSLQFSKENISNIIVIGYNKSQSIIDNMSFKRISARINGDIEISKNLTVGYSTMLSNSQNELGNDNVFYTGSLINPITRAYDESGELLFSPSSYCLGFQQANPLFDTDKENVDVQRLRDRIYFNLFGKWEIINGLSFRTSLTSDWQFVENGTFYSPSTSVRLLNTNYVDHSKSTTKSLIFTNILNYNRTIADHSLDISVIHDMQTYVYDNTGLTGEDLPYYGRWNNVNEAPKVFTRSSSYERWSLLSFIGRINYIYKNRYLLTLTGRKDGSSRLAKGHKWDFFPSAALAWRISSEPFMESVSMFSDLKFRFSWGSSGNTAISTYSTLGMLGRAAYVFGVNEDAAIGYVATELPNSELGWERTEEKNIGLDFGFINNRINGSLDLYNRKTIDILLKRSLPITAGYNSTWQNIGKVRNKGIELALNTIPLSMKDWKWNLSISFAYNKNEIVELYGEKIDDSGNKWFIGQPLYVDWLYDFDGIWQLGEEDQALVYGRGPGNPKVKDVNGSNTYDTGDLSIYNMIPKWTGGLSSSLNYKNWDFNFYLYTRQNYGQSLGVLTNQAGSSSSRFNHLDVDFWTPTNPSNTFPKPKIADPEPLLAQSNYVYRDLSFVRLKNVNVGYNFPRQLIQKISAENIRIYLAVDNPYVWTLHEIEALDPENCLSFSSHRPLTTFIIGVNINF